jgi:hypothetical protein
MWEICHFFVYEWEKIKRYCADGWEPFSVDNGVVYLKKEIFDD